MVKCCIPMWMGVHHSHQTIIYYELQDNDCEKQEKEKKGGSNCVLNSIFVFFNYRLIIHS